MKVRKWLPQFSFLWLWSENNPNWYHLHLHWRTAQVQTMWIWIGTCSRVASSIFFPDRMCCLIIFCMYLISSAFRISVGRCASNGLWWWRAEGKQKISSRLSHVASEDLCLIIWIWMQICGTLYQARNALKLYCLKLCQFRHRFFAPSISILVDAPPT